MDRRFMFMKIFWAQGIVCPCPGAIYIYMTKIFKRLASGNGLANQFQTLCGIVQYGPSLALNVLLLPKDLTIIFIYVEQNKKGE